MKCPSCGSNNIAGADVCEKCHQDLTSVDGVVPKTKMEKVLMSDPISNITQRPPVTVKKNISVLDAVKQMNAARRGSLLVADGDRLEGIVTERDVVLKALGTRKDLKDIPIGAIMTANPETLSSDDSIAYAVNRMSIGGYRHIPILKNGKPTGMISIRDVMRHLSKLFP